MITVTGDSVEESNPSMDTLKSDLSQNRIGGIIMFTWSGNLNNPSQIAHLTSELRRQATTPLLFAIDEEGGKVARLGAFNGFSATPSAYQMGTVVNQESYTRSIAATMADWFVQTGINMNLAPVVDVNVNPSSPAIGGLGRSFSADPESVAVHAEWFIDEFHKENLLTVIKHFPGHGSATTDSHLGFTDVTTTWSPEELIPYSRLIDLRSVDAVMTAHVFNATIDSVYPATLSHATITGILRNQLGYQGVVVSDEMSMSAISSLFGQDEAMELAVHAGVDILLYNRNLDSAGNSLAVHVIDVLERSVLNGAISESRIDSSYSRILMLKNHLTTSVAQRSGDRTPSILGLMNYPNPFNATTTIEYRLPQMSHVTLSVYDMLGREVTLLVNDNMGAGVHEVRFNASTLSSGVYFYRLKARLGPKDVGGQATTVLETRRLLLLK
jgi:beta-N-acetylhexosaminidase